MCSIAALGITLGTNAHAQSKADLARGQQIATTVCAACHGPDGNSALAVNPNLAAQGEQYIASQLALFKSGKEDQGRLRASPIMQGIAAGLVKSDTQDDMKALGVYFSIQKLNRPAIPASKEQALKGQAIYRAGIRKLDVPACAGCHSPNGAGIPAQYPRLAGQWPEYTYQSLKNYASEQRKHPVMSAIAKRLNDEQMQAVAQYTAGLR
jgi:cytochrome c553